jgi:hypothetical protein
MTITDTRPRPDHPDQALPGTLPAEPTHVADIGTVNVATLPEHRTEGGLDTYLTAAIDAPSPPICVGSKHDVGVHSGDHRQRM